MSFGKNLQFLRHLRGNMTQEDLAEKMHISRQTVSKWELDAAQPEMEKAVELCGFFNCTLDDLFRGDMVACGETYTNLRVETVPAFRYIKHAVISADPEGDAVNNVISIARSCGWIIPALSAGIFRMCHRNRSMSSICTAMRRRGYCRTGSFRLTVRYTDRQPINMRQYTLKSPLTILL